MYRVHMNGMGEGILVGQRVFREIGEAQSAGDRPDISNENTKVNHVDITVVESLVKQSFS